MGSASVSGVVPRKVLPACGGLCYFCPSLRARSRQPVKRYKKILAEIFPATQDVPPNERRIGKLCDYVARNPHRVPNITEYLEQRCYKELRKEQYGFAKVVMLIYRRLLVSCKDQMYQFNMEELVPRLCELAQVVKVEEKSNALRASALQALSAMIWFMGELSHISSEFDNVVQVVLESYKPQKMHSDNNYSAEAQGSGRTEEVLKAEGRASPSPSSFTISRISSWKSIVSDKGEIQLPVEDAKDPNFWSRVCVHNMAKLSREATTFRRVLESLFHHFDNNNSWSSLNTLALSVLSDMQMLMENSGQNMNLMISILVKHLEHKSISKQPEVQLSIVEVIAALAEQSRAQASAATIGAISDLVRHMKKTLHVAVGSTDLEVVKWNDKLQKAVDDCIVQLSKKVGDAGPVLDMMSVMLEDISRTPLIAIATTSAVYRTSQTITSIPNLSYMNKVFPEVLFHQLLVAMVHPDHETRVAAHRIFSVVLVPSSVSPFPHSESPDLRKKHEIQRTLSRAVSVFSSSAALFDKLRRDTNSFRENTQGGNRSRILYGNGDEIASPKDLSGSQSRKRSFRVPNLSIKRVPSSSLRSSASLKEDQNSCNEMIAIFEALAPSFQVAFSLVTHSLQETVLLSPSRRRSLFTLATSMIIFSSRAFNVAPLIPICKSVLSETTAVKDYSEDPSKTYGSPEDDANALKFLAAVNLTASHSRESMTSTIMNSITDLPDTELESIRSQLLSDFCPDEMCPINTQFFEAPSKNPLWVSDDDFFLQECEALSMGKQQKMSAFMSFRHSWQASNPENNQTNHPEAAHISSEQNTNPFLQQSYPTCGGAQAGGHLQQQHLLKLPASSPYDNFLKAAGF